MIMKRNEAIKIVKSHYPANKQMLNEALEFLIPELAESEDERIRNFLIYYINHIDWGDWDFSRKQCIDWLEKQGKSDLVNFDKAEQEKYDFVSGQYIECRVSFNEFKEDNSYWLEYIGNDTYIGRSDNILNQKFHITPRQLFTLFCPKEDNSVNEETNAPTGYGKYVDECLNEASKHFFSEDDDKYSVADLFYAGVRCGKSWIEKQGVQKSLNDVAKEVTKNKETAMSFLKSCGIMNANGELADEYKIEQGEQKSADSYCQKNCKGFQETGKCFADGDCKVKREAESIDKAEPKFKVGEYI